MREGGDPLTLTLKAMPMKTIYRGDGQVTTGDSQVTRGDRSKSGDSQVTRGDSQVIVR